MHSSISSPERQNGNGIKQKKNFNAFKPKGEPFMMVAEFNLMWNWELTNQVNYECFDKKQWNFN
jgi:hypothetical protein